MPEGMYDSEKWASDYVVVRSNYQYPSNEYGRFEVPTCRGEQSKSRNLVFDCLLRLLMFRLNIILTSVRGFFFFKNRQDTSKLSKALLKRAKESSLSLAKALSSIPRG